MLPCPEQQVKISKLLLRPARVPDAGRVGAWGVVGLGAVRDAAIGSMQRSQSCHELQKHCSRCRDSCYRYRYRRYLWVARSTPTFFQFVVPKHLVLAFWTEDRPFLAYEFGKAIDARAASWVVSSPSPAPMRALNLALEARLNPRSTPPYASLVAGLSQLLAYGQESMPKPVKSSSLVAKRGRRGLPADVGHGEWKSVGACCGCGVSVCGKSFDGSSGAAHGAWSIHSHFSLAVTSTLKPTTIQKNRLVEFRSLA